MCLCSRRAGPESECRNDDGGPRHSQDPKKAKVKKKYKTHSGEMTKDCSDENKIAVLDSRRNVWKASLV